MFGNQVQWLVVGLVRVLDRVVPKYRPIRIALLILSVWGLWTAGEYFVSWQGSRTSPSGTVPNPAYHHLDDAIVKGTLYTILCLGISGALGYWYLWRNYR
jgi:hypothetical protein